MMDSGALLRAWVEIESRWQSGDKGHKIRFRIVGSEELIGMKDYISMDSPMAHALLKKEVGDEAIVKTATGPLFGVSLKLNISNKMYSVSDISS